MTERENYLLVMNKKQPEWVPNYETAVEVIVPAIFLTHFMTPEMRDYFSVPWVMNEAGGPMVDTRQPHVMEDINDWRKFVHFPDLEAFDWEGAAKMQLAQHDPNKSIMIMPNMGGGTMFMPLMNMMGFEEGLCAIVEEPEVCQEFFAYVSDFIEACIPYIVKYYKPDTIIVGDDLCSAMGSFISMNSYAELLRPYYKKHIDAIHKEGVFVELHMCGKCEPYVYDFAEMGVDSWEPAQGSNDIAAIKAKYGNNLVIVGTWCTDGPAWRPGVAEEVVRAEVRNCIDKYAPGGGMVLWTAGVVGMSQEQKIMNDWVNDEAAKYGREFY